MSAVLSFVLKLKKNDLKYKLCPYSYVGRLIFTYETTYLGLFNLSGTGSIPVFTKHRAFF